MVKTIMIIKSIYGIDLVFDVITLIIIAILLSYSIRFYFLNKSNLKYKLFLTSFSLLAVSFIFKILSHINIYFSRVSDKDLGLISSTYQGISQTTSLVFWGLLIYRILSIFSIYIFYQIYSKKLDAKLNSFIVYLILLVGYVGHFNYYVYHITFSALLLINILSLRDIYISRKTITTKNLLDGFWMLLASQIIFIFISIHNGAYLFGEVIQLGGYISILVGFIKAIKNGTKKER